MTKSALPLVNYSMILQGINFAAFVLFQCEAGEKERFNFNGTKKLTSAIFPP